MIEARIDEIDRVAGHHPAAISGLLAHRVRPIPQPHRGAARARGLPPHGRRKACSRRSCCATWSASCAARLESFEAIPPLDLGLDVDMLIRNVPLLGELDDAALAELRRLLVARLALPGRADRPPRRARRRHVLHRLRRGRGAAPGDEVVRLGTGEFFGEMALIMRRPRVADVVALSYCRLLVLRRDAFRDFLRSHPQLMQQVRRAAEERLRAIAVAEERWPRPERMFHVKHRLTCRCRTWRRSGPGRPRRRRRR